MVKDASKGKTQKLIIPKGTIDSADTTIIEIPMKLHGQPVVVAKKKHSEKSFNLDGTEYSFDAGNRDGVSFSSPHQTVLSPGSFADFEKGLHHSSIIEDRGGLSPSKQRVTYPGDIHQQPFLTNDRYGVPPPRPYGSSPRDILQQQSSRYDRRPFPNDYFPSSPQPSDVSDVTEMEQAEKQLILEELQKYHEARRRFLEDASAIATKSKMRVSRPAERPESLSRNYESPQRDATGPCNRPLKSSTKLSCPHCTFESQSSSAESFVGCRDIPKYSSSCQTEVPVKKVYPTKPTVYHTSSTDCRTCCSLTDKSPASEDQRKRMFSTQDLCEIATQFREARKKLDKVIAQATQPANCASGLSLAPCQKHSRNQSPNYRSDVPDSRSCSNVPVQSNPRELDPLLVSRHLRTETGPRSVIEKKKSAGEEERYGVDHAPTRPIKGEIGRVSSELVSSPPTHQTQTQSSSSRSSNNVETADSYAEFMKALWKDDRLKSDTLNNSTSIEQTPKGYGKKHSSSILVLKTNGTDFTSSSYGGNSTGKTTTGLAVSSRPSEVPVPEKPVEKKSTFPKFGTSTTTDEDADKSVKKKHDSPFIPVSKTATKINCGPHTSKSICLTCCNKADQSQDIRSVPSILASQELMKIRQQFQEATRRIEQTLASLPSSGVCGSNSGTFPCQKYR